MFQRVRVGLIVAGLALSSTALALIDEQVPVTLNDRPVGQGVVIQGGVALRVGDVARTINGTPQLAPRLQIKEGQLMGVTAGGCGACPVKVREPGKSIATVLTKDGAEFVHIEALSAALGGSVKKTKAGANIEAAPCTTCTLSVVLPAVAPQK